MVNQKVAHKRAALALALGLMCSSGPVLAQSADGSIEGTVIGAQSGVEVRIRDEARGTTKTVSPGSDGDFRFTNIPPGNYTIETVSGNSVIDSDTISVALSGTVSVVMAGMASAIEEITVTGARVQMMDAGISEAGVVLSAEEINELPVARDVDNVTLLAPGVTAGDVSFAGNSTSFAGASIAENTAYINGLNLTNFRNGLGYSTVPFEFYDTIQVKTGGYSAKYGRSTGGVINARSRSGTNEFDFGINVYREDLLSNSPNTFRSDNEMDEFGETNVEVYASGALIQDRLFVYGLYNQRDYDEEAYGVASQRGNIYNQEAEFWGVKVDAYLTDDHRLEYTAFSDTRETNIDVYDYDPVNNVTTGYVGPTTDYLGGDNWIATYTGDITDTFQISASYGENNANRTTLPATGNFPIVQQVVAGSFQALGGWADPFVTVGEDTREMLRLDLTWDLGDHLIEAGLDDETNTSTNNEQYSGGGIYWLRHPNNDTATYACDVVTECPSGANARLRVYRNGGEFETLSNAYYIQDTWTVNDQLSVQLGLRNSSFENKNANGDTFVEATDQWAPRFNFTYDPTGDGNSQFFGSYGLYYLPIAANTNIRMAGGELFTEDYYDWDGVSFDPATDVPTNVAATPYDSQVYSDGTVKDTRSLADFNLDPMYQSEIILGYQWFTEDDWELAVKGIYRNMESTLEDVAIDAAVIEYYNNGPGTWDPSLVGGDLVEDVFGGFHQYVLTNPGNDMVIYIPEMDEVVSLSAEDLLFPEATRQYFALEFTFGRPFDGKWALNGSYTWAQSWGNHEGYVKSDNGQDDAGITTSFDQPGLLDGASGFLPNDRRHTIKAYGIYQFDNGIRVGANALWQTGRPKNCFGVHPTDVFAADYDNESFYCGGVLGTRGSYGTMDTMFNLDLNAQYEVEVGDDSSLIFSVDVFNVLDGDAVLEIHEEDDQNYGLPTAYQSPRSIRFGARYNF